MIYHFETDDEVEARLMMFAADMHAALREVDNLARQRIKYGGGVTPEEDKTLVQIREQIRDGLAGLEGL